MHVSEEGALDILTKWKDQSASLFIFGQKPSRWGLRSVDELEGAIDWNIALRGKISDVLVSKGVIAPNTMIIGFESPSGIGRMSLLMETCVFSYEESCASPPFLPLEAASCLFIFFASNELFVIYELRER